MVMTLESMSRGSPAYAKLIGEDLTRFRQLRNQWTAETEVLSSMTRIVAHPAYREVVKMGWTAVPFILDELKREPDWWFTALREITGENPAPADHAGDLLGLTADWLKWGQANGYA